MTRTVDVVIVGGDAAAVAATIDAAGRGQRVLVVIRARRSGFARRLRQAIGTAMVLGPGQVSILTGAEVACADGVRCVEAVVVRQIRTRRLIGFNASALVAFGRPAPQTNARACDGHGVEHIQSSSAFRATSSTRPGRSSRSRSAAG
jgi:hypothetical protein